MIVPLALQDLRETMMPESSASSSARDNGDDHHTSSSSSSSSKETLYREEGTRNAVSDVSDLLMIGEWESKTIMGRLSNLRKAPADLPVGFRFKAALHHEVADSVPSISGYKKLEEITGWIPVYVDHFEAGLRFHLPGLIFDLLADYKLALTQLTPYSIRFIIGFMLLCARLAVPAKVIVFRSMFQCRLCPNSRGAKWYYLSGREKSQLFKNVKNKMARWKRQFVFVRNMRTEQISNDLAARLSEWHLEALVTSEQLVVFRFVDMANLFTKAYLNANVNEPKAHGVAERAAPCNDRRGSMSGLLQHHNHATRRTVAPAWCPGLSLSSGLKLRPPVHAGAHARRLTVKMRSPSYGAEQVGGLSLRRRLNLRSRAHQTRHRPWRKHAKLYATRGLSRARTFVQQHGGQVAMVKLMDIMESRANELANRNNEIREELERARAKKKSGIQAAKDEATRVEERAKKAKDEKERALNELSSLKNQIVEADKNFNAAEEALNELKTSHGRFIYNEIRGKVLHHHPDFPIRELAFFDGEDIDEQGKSLAPLADTMVRLRWDLNEEGVPIWPSSVLEEGEDPMSLPSFDSWVEGALVTGQEPSSTPPNSQPAAVPARLPVIAPAPKPTICLPPTCSSPPTADASMPVNLTDD
ncbi:hypothetical protein SLEP1_g3770 [Rubroshorea leprosula]|uniref:Transposase (putative) gypsy type domain-containing protein n=1 Tax=Rubroshorea leprosula TaxID=152421 RepID=A0AAV5HVD4_9ROSI|nr:hypothetical protein SLEP1_g3770 [Rubroshorea leprosula]